MKNTILVTATIALIHLWFPTLASSQSSAVNCAGIASAVERLDCYDNISKGDGVSQDEIDELIYIFTNKSQENKLNISGCDVSIEYGYRESNLNPFDMMNEKVFRLRAEFSLRFANLHSAELQWNEMLTLKAKGSMRMRVFWYDYHSREEIQRTLEKGIFIRLFSNANRGPRALGSGPIDFSCAT